MSRTLRIAEYLIRGLNRHAAAVGPRMRLNPEYSWVRLRRRVALDESYYQDAMDRFDRSLPFKNLFGKKNTRIVLPFVNSVKYKISQALSKIGYDHVDWSKGEAIKTYAPDPKAPPGTPPKTQRTKIGKAIARLPDGDALLKWWGENKELSQKDDYSIVISPHPVDVMRMSDHDSISSCHSPGGSEWGSCISEVQHGGLVAYMVENQDIEDLSSQAISGRKEIFRDDERNVDGITPLSRVRIRRFTHVNGDFDLAIPETRTYGERSPEFQSQVTDWARVSQADLITQRRWRMKDFVRRGGKYADNSDGDLFNKFFGDNLDHGNTTFGVAGKEGEDTAERLRAEIAEIHRRWQNTFEHSSTDYEEVDWGDPDEELRFSWSGGISVGIAKDRFVDPADLSDLEKMLNRGDGSLSEVLSENGFYVGDGEIYASSYGRDGNVHFSIDVRDPDGGYGDPDEYNDFCQTVYGDFDQRYDELQKVIFGWLIENDFVHPTPVRQFDHSSIQLKNFAVEVENGEMEAVAEAPIGPYDPEFWSEANFRDAANQAIRNLVSNELQRVIRSRKDLSGYLPGFQPEVPPSVKEDYDLSNFSMFLQRSSDRRSITLKILFQADDLTSQEDMQEVIELMTIVDRIFPLMIGECGRLLERYYKQIRDYTVRYLQNQNDQAFEFDPNSL